MPPPLTPSQSQMLGELLSAGGWGGSGGLESPTLAGPASATTQSSKLCSSLAGIMMSVCPPGSFIGLCLQVPPELELCFGPR